MQRPTPPRLASNAFRPDRTGEWLGKPYTVALSGGTAYGAAYVVWLEAIAHIHNRIGTAFDTVSTGVLSGALAAADKLPEHRAEYERLRGRKDFARLRWWAPWTGLYDLSPLRKRMAVNRFGENLAAPVYANFVQVRGRKACRVDLGTLPVLDAHDAAIAGATWPKPIMERTFYRGEAVMDLGAGGGTPDNGAVLHSFTANELETYAPERHYILVATPVGTARRDFPDADDLDPFEEAMAAYQLIMARFIEEDVERAVLAAQTAGVPYRVLAPKTWDGLAGPFDATPSVRQARFDAAIAAWT